MLSVGRFSPSEVSGKLIKDLSLDYMHLVWLGPVPRMLHYFKRYFKGINSGKLSFHQLTELSNKLTQLNGNFPSEFSRQPRSLAELERWKTTELRSFLHYSAPVILRNILSFDMWKYIAIRVLCEEDRRLRNSNLSSARQLLEYFVLNAKEHYPETFCVYNIRGLLHVSDDVEYFRGSLDENAAFQFESYLGKLKRLLQAKHNPLSQTVKRCKEIPDFQGK